MKQDFLEFAFQCQAIKSGQFVLKDGSSSDIFFDSSSFNTGFQLQHLAQLMAQAIGEFQPNCNLIYGSAYKGIPLAAAVAIEFARLSGREVGYLFDRKEEKTHGDGGHFVGRTPVPGDTLVFVDDVITSAGTKITGIEKVQQAFGVGFAGILVAVDRRTPPGEGVLGVPVHALCTLSDVRDFAAQQTAGARS